MDVFEKQLREEHERVRNFPDRLVPLTPTTDDSKAEQIEPQTLFIATKGRVK